VTEPEFIDQIKLLVLDVDGVMTPGHVVLDHHGRETKTFHVRDGLAIKVWMALGNHVAIITARRSMAVIHRARELGVPHVHTGVENKLATFRLVLEELALQADQAAAIGDDLQDLALLRAAGYAMTVADAAVEVREIADYVTSRPGGFAAVREAVEHLLKEQDRWDDVVAQF